MKRFYPITGILFLLLGTIPEVILAQSETGAASDSTGLIDFTNFPRTDPFQSEKIIRISLKFDMKTFIRTKYKEEYQKATLTVNHLEADTVERQIMLRARGITRKSICYFPPIKLNFKKPATEDEYLNDNNSLKLVTHCKNADVYEQYLLKEYLVYRMYNLLTDSSFRVRLLQIDYVDSEDRIKPFTRYGFIIESNDHLAERLQGLRLEREGINTWDTDSYLANLMAVFQYMIGNTDWSIPVLHNIKLVKPRLPNSNILAIPYDFDYSGMVNTLYAVPAKELGIESVRTRVYRGFCPASDDHFHRIFKLFLENKQSIYALVEDFELLDKKSCPEMLAYLDEFYATIETPLLARREIMDACRKIPVR